MQYWTTLAAVNRLRVKTSVNVSSTTVFKTVQSYNNVAISHTA